MKAVKYFCNVIKYLIGKCNRHLKTVVLRYLHTARVGVCRNLIYKVMAYITRAIHRLCMSSKNKLLFIFLDVNRSSRKEANACYSSTLQERSLKIDYHRKEGHSQHVMVVPCIPEIKTSLT